MSYMQAIEREYGSMANAELNRRLTDDRTIDAILRDLKLPELTGEHFAAAHAACEMDPDDVCEHAERWE